MIYILFAVIDKFPYFIVNERNMNNLNQENLMKAFSQLIEVQSGKPYERTTEIPRICGYLEACLQNEGILNANEELPKKDIEYKVYIFFGPMRTRKEGYVSMIIRLCLEYINDNNIDIKDYEPYKPRVNMNKHE